jgi:hypothetical protein
MGLEGVVLLSFGGDQGVEAAQARGDALLFSYGPRNAQWAFDNATLTEMRLIQAIIISQQVGVPIQCVVEEFAVDLLWF